MGWLLLVVGVLLTLGTGVFVASEFALVSLDRSELEARRERGDTGLNATIGALKHTSRHLSSAQLGITVTTLLAGFTFEPGISQLLGPLFIGWGWAEVASTTVSLVLGVVITTGFSLLIGELVPKSFAIAVPRRVARAVIPVQLAFTTVFRPLVFALDRSAAGVLRLFGVEAKEELSSARGAEELSALVTHSADAGSLEEDTASLLRHTLGFSELSASDVMTPRTELVTMEADSTAADVVELARETGFSRFPVVGEAGPDEVLGVVHLKRAVSVPRPDRAACAVTSLLVPAVRVPETMRLDVLLSHLRAAGLQLVVVIDEYGGTAGVATLEDVVEELVGEVSDEHDTGSLDLPVSRESGGEVSFSGLLRPDELWEHAEIRVPEEGPYETVAGFVIDELGRMPLVGDEVRIGHGLLRVERMDGSRIDRLRYLPDPSESSENPDGGDDNVPSRGTRLTGARDVDAGDTAVRDGKRSGGGRV